MGKDRSNGANAKAPNAAESLSQRVTALRGQLTCSARSMNGLAQHVERLVLSDAAGRHFWIALNR